MKRIFGFIAILLLYSVSLALTTPRLYLKGHDTKEKYIVLNYEVTHAGYVELHLSNKKAEKIWIKGKVIDQKGIYKFPIPRKPLEDGERYTYILKFKGKDYSGSFYH